MIDFFKRIIPKPLKSSIKRAVHDHLLAQYNEKIPDAVYEFSEKHLKNTRVLPDRITMIQQLQSNGTIAEIGVDEGNFSSEIVKHCSPAKLYLIDSWHTDRYNTAKMEKVRSKFKQEIQEESVILIRKKSIIASEDFDNQFFDWVYIDTDHSYEMTLQELYAYKDKIKKDGMIAGHDFVKGNIKIPIKYGVMEAVAEFCTKENWELIYISLENSENSSFAIKKM